MTCFSAPEHISGGIRTWSQTHSCNHRNLEFLFSLKMLPCKVTMNCLLVKHLYSLRREAHLWWLSNATNHNIHWDDWYEGVVGNKCLKRFDLTLLACWWYELFYFWQLSLTGPDTSSTFCWKNNNFILKLGKSYVTWKLLSGFVSYLPVSNHVYIGSDNGKFPTANVDIL